MSPKPRTVSPPNSGTEGQLEALRNEAFSGDSLFTPEQEKLRAKLHFIYNCRLAHMPEAEIRTLLSIGATHRKVGEYIAKADSVAAFYGTEKALEITSPKAAALETPEQIEARKTQEARDFAEKMHKDAAGAGD